MATLAAHPRSRADAAPIEQHADPARPIELKTTYCQVCMTNCGLVAEVQGDRILKVKADRDHPLTRGYSCPKGRATGLYHHLEDAITRPMMRKGGALVEVSWDEALDDVALRLRQAIDAHGPHAVGMYFGSGLGSDSAGYAMMDAFYHALGTPPKFTPLTNDGTAKTMLAGAMGGFLGLNPKTHYDTVELLIYVGTNPMVSHAHNTGMFNPGNILKGINRRGGEIWVIDPVRTETANYARGHIAAYPGKDYAILAWIVRELLDGGPLTPKQPVQGLDRLRAALDGYTLPLAAEIAGVAPAEMEALLAAIRTRGRVAIETGTGITMSAGCNLTQWLAWTIMVLTGSMNEVGGTWFHPSFLTPFESFELPVTETPFTPGSNVRPDVKGLIGDWPCAVLPLEIEGGHIRALFNFGGSILRSFPDTNALERALPKLDLHVVTEIVHTDATAYATHILPTKDRTERAEVTRWDTLPWEVSMQYAPPLVEPMGERRSAWWVIAEVMRRAGLPVPPHVPADDRAPDADDQMLSALFFMARAPFEQVRAERYVRAEVEFPAPWIERHFERMGGWRLAFPDIVAQWDRMRAHDEANLGRPKPLCYSSRRQRRKFNAQLSFLGEPADIILAPETAAERGITDGQAVRVWNKSGEIVLTARIDPTMRRSVGSIAHGHLGGNVNRLTSCEDMDPLGGMAFYSGVPIEVAPA